MLSARTDRTLYWLLVSDCVTTQQRRRPRALATGLIFMLRSDSEIFRGIKHIPSAQTQEFRRTKEKQGLLRGLLHLMIGRIVPNVSTTRRQETL